MRFAKYHGIGNDFLVVDLRDRPAESEAVQDPEMAIALCDRRFGVGGDGVLAILPSTVADARMRVLNSDGSEAEMCGNGLRCVVKELYDRGGLRKPEVRIETGNGVLACAVEDAGGLARSVTVQMGAPRFLRGEIPIAGPANERCIDQPFELTGKPMTCVSTGNPHAITFVDSRGEADRLAHTLGPAIETHAWFPKRTNVEFAHIHDREIDLVVWERGCGITLACGTGACATAVAAIVSGRIAPGGPIAVHLPGGTLSITVLPDFANVLMQGPAQHVFDAAIDLLSATLRVAARSGEAGAIDLAAVRRQ